MSDKRPTIEVHAEVPTPDAVRTFYEVPDAVASQIGVLDHKASFVENLVSLLAGKAYAVEAVNVAAIHHVDKMRDLRDQHNSETRKDCESGCDTHRTCREDRGPCTHGLTAGRGTAERCLECGEAVGEPRPENPYRTVHARMSPPGAAWDEGFAAGRAAERGQAWRWTIHVCPKGHKSLEPPLNGVCWKCWPGGRGPAEEHTAIRVVEARP